MNNRPSRLGTEQSPVSPQISLATSAKLIGRIDVCIVPVAPIGLNARVGFASPTSFAETSSSDPMILALATPFAPWSARFGLPEGADGARSGRINRSTFVAVGGGQHATDRLRTLRDYCRDVSETNNWVHDAYAQATQELGKSHFHAPRYRPSILSSLDDAQMKLRPKSPPLEGYSWGAGLALSLRQA